AIMKVLSFTPFPYQLFFPVSIYVGKSTGSALYQGLLIQFLWVVAAYLFARFMWARGIRKYAAAGGGIANDQRHTKRCAPGDGPFVIPPLLVRLCHALAELDHPRNGLQN